jgi:hypothetical protein
MPLCAVCNQDIGITRVARVVLLLLLLLLLQDERERYVFFSFPHIAIDMEGQLGGIFRPNRPGRSCACGALQKVCWCCPAAGGGCR